MLKLDQLEVLDAVVRAGSFAKAANEILLVSQPAVSAAIRKLEASLGFELFDRSNYRPSLTRQGQAFYARAQVLLEAGASLAGYARLLAEGVEPELRIAAEPDSLRPELLQAFRAQTDCFAQTRFEFLDEPVGGAVARLMDDDAELAICNWQPAAYGALPLEHQLLFSFEVSTMIAPDHALMQGSGPLLPEDLVGSIQIVTRSNDRYLPVAGFALQPQARHWHVNDQLTKQQLIQAGLGFGMLAHHVVAADLKAGRLLPFSRLPGYRVYQAEIHRVRRRDRPHGPVAVALWQALQAIGAIHLDT